MENATDRKSYVVSMSVSRAYVEHAQYHQGVSSEVALGVGSTPADALADALESVAQGDAVVLCDWPDAVAEFGEDADRDMVADAMESELPAVRWQVRHCSVTGCHPITADNATDYDTLEDALARLRGDVELMRERGFPVTERDPAVHGTDGEAYDVEEPDGCGMIPEEVGTLSVWSNADDVERERERAMEMCELHVYVEVELETVGPDDYSSAGVPSVADLAVCSAVRAAGVRAARESFRSFNGQTWDNVADDVREHNAAHYARDLAERVHGIIATAPTMREGYASAARVLGCEVRDLPMEEFRGLARDSSDATLPTFAWPGGYVIAYVMDDGALLCAQCANTEASVHLDGDGDGWRIDGWTVLDDRDPDAPELEECAHCGMDVDPALRARPSIEGGGQ